MPLIACICAGDLTSDLEDHFCVQIESLERQAKEVGVEEREG